MTLNRKFTASSAAALALLFTIPSCGGSSGGGAPVQPVDPATPPAVTELKVAITNNQLVLTWKAAKDAKQYKVYASTSPSVKAEAANLVATVDALTATHMGKPYATQFYFVVAGVNGSKEGPVSNEVTAKVEVADTLLGDLWHIKNTGQAGGTAGEDANVEGAWAMGITGKGVRIAVVDDGVDIKHEDLARNVVAGKSKNFLNNSDDPTPSDNDNHGTLVAGICSAVGKNGIGVSGIAYDSELVGYKVGSGAAGISKTTEGLGYDQAANSIMQVSLGPEAGGNPMPETPAEIVAIEKGVKEGRGGKGLIYVLSGSNEGHRGGQNGLDEQYGHWGVIGVSALNDKGKRADFAAPGSSTFVVAPSGNISGHMLSTTDVTGDIGANRPGIDDYPNRSYSRQFNGCSAATPVVSGVVALMLQARPELGWRDVRLVLAKSARKVDPMDALWQTNAAGVNYHTFYGFGCVDAKKAVEMAKTWTLVTGPQKLKEVVQSPNLDIPDTSTFVTTSMTIASSGITKIEHVRVGLQIQHPDPSELTVALVGPTKSTQSTLFRSHPLYAIGNPPKIPAPEPNLQQEVATQHFLDEPADGTWTLFVRDERTGKTGKVVSWQLSIRGR